MKKCFKCKKLKPITNYCKNQAKPDGLSTECKDCRRNYMKRYYKLNKKHLDQLNKQRSKVRHLEAKVKVVKHYTKGLMSCMCNGCDVHQLEFLTVNHINGGGQRDRKNFRGARTFYEYLVKAVFPEGLNILCYNCNCSNGFFGYCPHSNP